MDRINRWKLAARLTVFQISLLIAGYDPSEFDGEDPSNWASEVKINTAAFITAIKNASKNEKLKFYANYIDIYSGQELDWNTSTICVQSLRQWLYERNYEDRFFISKGEDKEKLFDTEYEFYAPKLAAPIRAWDEVTSDPKALSGKSPKKALDIWLRKHANEYGPTGKDGDPNKLGIEEICKVANWKPNGGASPTPLPPSSPTTFGKPSVGGGEWGGRLWLISPTPFAAPYRGFAKSRGRAWRQRGGTGTAVWLPIRNFADFLNAQLVRVAILSGQAVFVGMFPKPYVQRLFRRLARQRFRIGGYLIPGANSGSKLWGIKLIFCIE